MVGRGPTPHDPGQGTNGPPVKRSSTCHSHRPDFHPANSNSRSYHYSSTRHDNSSGYRSRSSSSRSYPPLLRRASYYCGLECQWCGPWATAVGPFVCLFPTPPFCPVLGCPSLVSFCPRGTLSLLSPRLRHCFTERGGVRVGGHDSLPGYVKDTNRGDVHGRRQKF